MFKRIIIPCFFYVFFYILTLNAQEIEHPYGGDLPYGENVDPGALNPYDRLKPTDVTDHLFAMIYERLVRYDFYENKTYPVLAESWNLSPDNTSITFILRQNTQWHDGTPFTSQDVKFTYDFIKSRRRQSVNYYKTKSIDFIKEVKIIDDYKIQFIFNEPESEVTPRFDFWIIPKHRFTDDLLNKNDRKGNLSVFPIGTGPYKFHGQALNKNIRISVNNNYWNKKGHIKRVEMHHIADRTSMINRLINGGIKLVIETPPKELTRVENAGDYNTEAYTSFRIHAFAYNNKNEFLKYRKVRQAMTYATNRIHLLNEWYNGKGEVLFGPVVSAHPYYNDNLAPRPFDINTAKNLLDQAGFKDSNNDNVRESPDTGKNMEFELIYPSSTVASETETQSVIESFANWMKDIGIIIIQKPLIMDKYLDQSFKNQDFDIVWIQWTFDNSYDITSLFHSNETEPGDDNFINYKNDQVDALINEYFNSNDKELRRACINSIQKILNKDCPYTFLYNIDNYASIHYSYQNVRIEPYYFFTFLPEWYIAEEYIW